MNMMLITFLCKMADNALSTLKNIFLHKGNYMASSLFSAGGTFFYMVAMVNAIKDNSLWSIIAMCLATFLGSYLPAKLIERMEEDQLYVYEITSHTFDEGLELADMIRDMNIPIKTTSIYNDTLEKVLEIKVFCSTKGESAIIKDMIKDDFKYHAYVAKEY